MVKASSLEEGVVRACVRVECTAGSEGEEPREYAEYSLYRVVSFLPKIQSLRLRRLQSTCNDVSQRRRRLLPLGFFLSSLSSL